MATNTDPSDPRSPTDKKVEYSDHFSETPPAQLATPAACVADFCLIPIGTPTASVSNQIADVQRLMQTCGLGYEMHSAGTTYGPWLLHGADMGIPLGVEGSWDDVMRVIGRAHTMLHEKGVVRIQTDIRVGSRTDKKQRFKEKVTAVTNLLAMDGKPEGKGEY